MKDVNKRSAEPNENCHTFAPNAQTAIAAIVAAQNQTACDDDAQVRAQTKKHPMRRVFWCVAGDAA
ncbi:MAG: hypothetical protein ACOH2B_11565 [Burkholderiaceae bacterium]